MQMADNDYELNLLRCIFVSYGLDTVLLLSVSIMVKPVIAEWGFPFIVSSIALAWVSVRGLPSILPSKTIKVSAAMTRAFLWFRATSLAFSKDSDFASSCGSNS